MTDRAGDLRRQMNTLWRTALEGFDTLREVAIRSSHAGRLRVDVALLAREKQLLLVTLGEQVAALISSESLEVPDHVRRTFERVQEIERRIDSDAGGLRDHPSGPARGYEPEAGNYAEDSEPDEHAEVAETSEARPKKRRPATRKDHSR